MSSVKVSYPTRTREDLVAALRREVASLAEEFPVEKAVLFGSYATGRHTVASDVDLLVVHRGDAREDAYAAVKRGVDVSRLEPHPVTAEEYARRRDHFDRMTEGGETVYEAASGSA